MKRLIQFLFLIMITPFVWCEDLSAQGTGFESGTLSGWTSAGGVSVSGASSNNLGGKAWVVSPYGTKMGMLYPSGSTSFDTALSTLGLSANENSAVRSFLSANAGGGSPTPTNAAYVMTTVALQAGVTYTFAWNYLSTDYFPFNDGSMMTLTHASNASVIPSLNNGNQRFALLGFTNPGSGNYSTGSYGSTGWQLAVFTVPEDGNYVLGFAAFNLGDTILSPILYIDEVQGSTTLNGQNFGPVAPNAGSTAPATPSEPTAPTLCCGGSAASFNINAMHQTNINTFLNRPHADSKVMIEQIGSYNHITVQQTGTNQNYLEYIGTGNNNQITVNQSGNVNTQVNYAEIRLGTTGSANNNTVNLTQQSTGGGKGAFITVNDNNNAVTLQQKDSGSHYAAIHVSGGSKTVDVIQQGSAGHMADITLSGPGSRSLNLTQGGSTQQFYSINSSCSSNCQAITVTQGQ